MDRRQRFYKWGAFDVILGRVEPMWPKVRRVVGYPRPGRVDNFDLTGLHYSNPFRQRIRGKQKGKDKRFNILKRQQRSYAYMPRITWDENPAFWAKPL